MPILDKFMPLSEPANLAVLIDHVCTFVERNQVTWNDVHDRPIKFDRVRAADRAADKIASMARGLAEGEALKPLRKPSASPRAMLVILSAAHSAARTLSNLIGRSWTSFHVTWLRSTKVHTWSMSTARLAGTWRSPNLSRIGMNSRSTCGGCGPACGSGLVWEFRVYSSLHTVNRPR